MTRSEPVVVATATGMVEAQIWLDMLRDDGIAATAVEVGPHGMLGGGGLSLRGARVLVGSDDVVRARELIAGAGGELAVHPGTNPDSAETRDRTMRLVFLAGGIAVAFLLIAAIAQAAG